MPGNRFTMVATISMVAIVGSTTAFFTPGSAPLNSRTPVWSEIRWPFPPDPFGPGLAFRCIAADCGRQIDLLLRAKIGLCGCIENITDDLVERMSDLDLFGLEHVSVGRSHEIIVHRMRGRSLGYKISAARSALAIAFHDRCDMVGATALIEGDEPLAHEDAVIAFLNSDLVLRWAEKSLGL